MLHACFFSSSIAWGAHIEPSQLKACNYCSPVVVIFTSGCNDVAVAFARSTVPSKLSMYVAILAHMNDVLIDARQIQRSPRVLLEVGKGMRCPPL